VGLGGDRTSPRARIVKNTAYVVVLLAWGSATMGLTGIQEPWDSILSNPSFYETNPLDYLWVVNTVSPDRIPVVAMPPELFSRYGDKVIGSFQRLVHASPDYMEWLRANYGVNEQQCLDSGDPHQPFAPANFFVVPTEHRIEWHWLLSSRAIDLGARQVMYEEPEFWHGTGYSEVMKRKYWEMYGEEVAWKDRTCTFLQRWRMERLKEKVLGDAYSELFRRVKEKDTGVTTIIPMHDIASYQLAKITSCFVQAMKNPDADVIQSQTWDWALEWAGDEKIAAYVDLAYWVFSSKFRKDLELWLLTDPVDDPLNVEVQNLRDYRAAVDAGILLGFYTHHIPWPASRIGAIRSSGWTRYEQEVTQNFRIHRSGLKFGDSRLAPQSCPKLGFLYSQARNYVTYASKETPGRDPLRDVTRYFAEDLLRRGQEFQVLETELIDQPGTLDGLAVIVADGEAGGFIPTRSCADALVEWIRSGGIVLWLGHLGSFHGVPEYSSSSLDYVADRLGVQLSDVRVTHPGAVKIELEKEGGEFQLPSGIYLTEPVSFVDVTGAQILYRLPGGRVFAWSKGFGKGRLVYFGYPMAEMRYRPTEHWTIIRKLLSDQGVVPSEDGLVRFQRTVNQLEDYEVIWLAQKTGSTNARIVTRSWDSDAEEVFYATVKAGKDLVVMKTPYFSAFSEDAIPVNTTYRGKVVEILLESRGRSWTIGSDAPGPEAAYIYLPVPEKVEKLLISGAQIGPAKIVKVDLPEYTTRVQIHFKEELPRIPGGTGQPIGEGLSVGMSILSAGLLGLRDRQERQAVGRLSTRA